MSLSTTITIDVIEDQQCESGSNVVNFFGKPRSKQLRTVRKSYGGGRPKITTVSQDRILEHILAQNRQITSSDVQRILEQQYNIKLSKRTIQRRLQQLKQIETAAKLHPNTQLPVAVRMARWHWALEHQEWSVQDWRAIFNMDDLKFEVERKTIFQDTLLGPPNSPDLSIVRNLMSIISPKIAVYKPQTVEEFKTVLYDIWYSDETLMDEVEQFYESMPDRIQSVIQSSGAETHYYDIGDG